MSTCDDVRPMLGAYADGQLSELETDAAVTHLEQCARCRQTVRDQQRVQHVLDSYQPQQVPDQRWNEIGKRLRMELEGKGERTVLKTRARIEALEPTPITTPSLRPDEVRTPFQRGPEVQRPPVRRPGTTAAPQLAVMVVRIKPRRKGQRWAWVAHAAGAFAAAAAIVIGMASMWLTPDLTLGPIGPIALARPQDVVIMDVEMTDPNYSVVVAAGDADDVAGVYVVPSADNG